MFKNHYVDIKNSIVTRLLRYVFACYVIIATAVTVVHMHTEYMYQKKSIRAELENIQKTFDELAGDIWHMDHESMQATLAGMLEIPEVVGVKILDMNGKYIAIGGVITRDDNAVHVDQHVNLLSFDRKEITVQEKVTDKLFKHQFPVMYRHKDKVKQMGEVIVFSSSKIVFNRVKVGFALLIINAIIKTVALWLIFILFANILLRRPLSLLTDATKKISLENLDSVKVDIKTSKQDELKVLEESFNAMIKNLHQSVAERNQIREDLVRLSTAIEQTHETIVITDENAIIQYVNPAFEKITGYSSSEAIGQNYRILQSGEHDENYYIDMWNTLTAGNTWQGRLVNKKKDDSIYHEDATISPVKDGSGTIVNYVAVKRDITSELRKEEQLQQSQKMESMGTLAGGIAHDFNNILGVIMGYTELCLDDMKNQSTTHQSLEQVLAATNRAKDLVRQILAFSRSSSINKIQTKTIPIVKEVCKFIRSSLPTTIEIKQHITAKHDLIMADPTQFHQILMNLCTNAGYEMKGAGGVLEVLLEEIVLDEDDLLSYPDLKPGPYLKVSVTDTGHGIKKEDLKRIFEPYFTTKGLGEGTGLGLAVVHGIVKDCGGDIKAYSEMGKGTVFHVLFPLIEEVEGTAPSIELEPIPTGIESIIFVDDEESLVNLGKKILERLGYRVTGFTSSEEALNMLKSSKESYDLIITDRTMPKMTGLELAEEIKKVRPDIPILLCTGFQDKGIGDKVNKAGISKYIMKLEMTTEN